MVTMHSDARVAQVAASQGGIVRTCQALESGVSLGRINSHLAAGRWRRVARGVYRFFDLDDPRDRLRAAVAALPNAVVSHESAGEFHRVPNLRRGLAVVTVHTRTTHSFPGVLVRRASDLGSHHVEIHHGLPTTTLPRTVVDLAGSLRPAQLEGIVDDLLADRRLELGELERVVADVARRGKSGSTALRALIEERAGSPVRGSRLERLGMELLQEAGFPEPVSEFPTPWDRSRRFDVAFPTRRLAIEWDSRRWHTQVEAFERDRQRNRQAILHGWRVLRFTWNDVLDRPGEVVASVRGVLSD